MRLIDIDTFRKEHRMNEHCKDCERNSRECQYNDFSMMDFCGWLDDATTVDAVPVVHGKWTERHIDYAADCAIDEIQTLKCSVCGLYHTTPYMYNITHYKFCPNCGAKMDLNEDQ